MGITSVTCESRAVEGQRRNPPALSKGQKRVRTSLLARTRKKTGVIQYRDRYGGVYQKVQTLKEKNTQKRRESRPRLGADAVDAPRKASFSTIGGRTTPQRVRAPDLVAPRVRVGQRGRTETPRLWCMVGKTDFETRSRASPAHRRVQAFKEKINLWGDGKTVVGQKRTLVSGVGFHLGTKAEDSCQH